jgi:hypothetical protein
MANNRAAAERCIENELIKVEIAAPCEIQEYKLQQGDDHHAL